MLVPGTRLGSYEVISPLGVGGMGEVFRARDLKLGRDVALKVLPQHLASDPDRIARFQREAQVLASLNHQHIAAIYGVEDAESVRALVLELVEGETLADRIARGAIPVDEALAIARQIAEALEAAHEQGIIHRDLKPANIKVNADGKVKVLDFGLAKLAESPAAASNPSALSMSPTITTPAMTQLGMILGTAAYMSPEQAKGRPADKRSDVWAFGCVLYEMLTGTRAFKGDDVSETLASVLKDEPLWEALPSGLPTSVRQMLRAMLQRNPADRLSSVPPLFFQPSAETYSPRSRRAMMVAAGMVVAVVVGMAVGYGFFAARQPAMSGAVKRVLLSPGFGQTLGRSTGVDPDVAIAPDGSHVAYVMVPSANTPELWIRDLQQLMPALIKTEVAPRLPFFSPDGEWVAFFDGPVLKKVSVKGGAVIPISTDIAIPRGGTWIDGDRIVLATNGLKLISAQGGNVESLTEAAPGAEGPVSHRWPERLPGKNAVLFTIWKGTHQQSDVAILDLATKRWRVILHAATNARYGSGHLVYAANNRLLAVKFDLDRLAIVGKPVQINADVSVKLSGAVTASVANDGSLVYTTGGGAAQRSFYWVDAKGNSNRATGLPEGEVVHPRISPDGTRLLYTRQDGGYDLWVYDFRRGTSEKLTSSPDADRDAVWISDGKWIAYFASGAPGGSGIFVVSAEGGEPRRLTTGDHRPTSWSGDDKRVVFVIVPGERGSNDIASVNVEGKPEVTLLLATRAAETLAVVSPNGRWMAYRSNEAGENAIYVRPYAGGNRRRISPGVGDQPFWGIDGTLYYRVDDRLMAVRQTNGPIDTWSTPRLVFEFPIAVVDLPRNIDVDLAGRFLVLRQAEEDANSRELVLVENWVSELRNSDF